MEPRANDTPLAQIGDDRILRDLVDRFYDLIETDPGEMPALRRHFRGHAVEQAREEQFNSLCGFLGGRRHHLEKRGHTDECLIHPDMPISAADAEDWLALMDRAITETRLSGPPVAKIRPAFRRVATTPANGLEEGRWPSARRH